MKRRRIIVLGLTITSSWGNGHATTYRGLLRELTRRGHDVVFVERDVPWYADNRDLPNPSFCRTLLYGSVGELRDRFTRHVRQADLVIVGSYVPDGVVVCEWVCDTARGVTAFYDIDTPVTLAGLERDRVDYLSRAQIPRYDLYLSFTGGPTLERLRRRFGARCARPLYCSVDPQLYYPEDLEPRWDLGYLGTYSGDRQPVLDRLMLRAAERWPSGRFVVAGPQYPDVIRWPGNVERTMHLAPAEHRHFYNALRFTLNVTRRDMVRAGYSPSVRLFEAAACGTPIISDTWKGLDRFFTPAAEILLSANAPQTLRYLREIPDDERRQLGLRARDRVLRAHTSRHRAAQLESYVTDAGGRTPAAAAPAGIAIEEAAS